jgi:hypothetical protein
MGNYPENKAEIHHNGIRRPQAGEGGCGGVRILLSERLWTTLRHSFMSRSFPDIYRV